MSGYYNYIYRSETPSSRQIVRGEITNLKSSLKDDDFQDYLANVSPAVVVFLFLCTSNPFFADKCYENGYTLPHIDDIRLDRWFLLNPVLEVDVVDKVSHKPLLQTQ